MNNVMPFANTINVIKFFLIILAFLSIWSNLHVAAPQNIFAETQTDVQHIFIHSLIAYPEILHKKNLNTISTYNNDCISYIEFSNLLNELYKNNFALVDINSTFYLDKNGNAKKTNLYLKSGRKPIVLSVDDVVYDPKKTGNGMVDKLFVNEQGNIGSITNINEKQTISYSKEFVPILENFIASHPDFSYKNARATINLTGFCGILGYRISDREQQTRYSEKIKAEKVVRRLKQLGYNFGCHTFGHYHMKKVSAAVIKDDLNNWQLYIEPIIGKTKIFVYPYGEWEIANGTKISEKQKLLNDYGFKLFCGVGINNFFSYLPLSQNIKEKILFMDRKNIDGYSLLNKQKELAELFNAYKIIDNYRLMR